MKIRILALLILIGIPAHAGQAGSKPVVGAIICASVLTNPIGGHAVAAVVGAKLAKIVNSRDDCLANTATVAAITTAFTGDPVLSALISGAFITCACKLVFD